jgi:hypothetical protein
MEPGPEGLVAVGLVAVGPGVAGPGVVTFCPPEAGSSATDVCATA